MSGGIIANVRLVKCPKCGRVLPELADVPVYKCGGCGAVLQAKIRKTKIEDSKSELSEPALANTTDLGHASSVDKTSSSSSQNENHIPTTDNPRDQSNNCRENNSFDCITDTEKGDILNVGNEVLAANEGKSEQSEPHDSPSDIKGKDDMDEARARSLFLSNNLPNESPSRHSGATNGLDHSVDSPYSFSCSDSENLPFSVRNSTVAVDTLCSDAVQSQINEEFQGSREDANHENATFYGTSDVDADELLIKRKRRPIVATDGSHHPMPPVVSKGLDGGPGRVNSGSTFSNPVIEELPSVPAKSFSPKEDRSAYEINYSDVTESQSRSKVGLFQKSSQTEYVSVGDLEPVGATEPSSSELIGMVGKMSISATTRSGHGYDGSISSYEDQDNQSYKQTFRDVKYVENDGNINFDTDKVPSIIAMQQQAREFFSSEKNHRIGQGSSWNPRESGEFMRYPIQTHMDSEAEIYPSRAPFNTRGYENGGSNGDFFDGVQSESSFYSTDKLPYTEQERMELLKMVYELKEEINRVPTNTGNGDRRNPPQFWSGRQMPVPHARREFVDEADPQSKFLRYPYTRSEQGTNWPHPQNHSRLPFSGDVTHYQRYHDGYSCQRPTVDHHFSAQLAPSVCSACSVNNGPQRVNLYSGEQLRNPYSSSTSSPQRYIESDFPSRIMESGFPSRVQDSNYVDQRLMERYVEASLANSSIATDRVRMDEVKMFQREKQPRVKLRIRPIAGGAPFITCHECRSLLQLPADSFLFKRRFHKLKCGSCSKILQYSLEDGTHIVPHAYLVPSANETNRRSPVNVRTSYENVSPRSRGNQISGSDYEFGNSYGRSFSAKEGKREILAASAHATEISEGKKKLFPKQFFSKDKRPAEITGSSSSNRTLNTENYSSESGEPKPRAGSPLHRLMGYTSISQVFRGPSKGANESFRNKTTK